MTNMPATYQGIKLQVENEIKNQVKKNAVTASAAIIARWTLGALYTGVDPADLDPADSELVSATLL
jgi:hypothetical protein